MNIESEVINGVTYYSMTARGIQYTLHQTNNEWQLHSKRLALGHLNPGSYKFFLTLPELEQKIKSFKGIAALIN